MLFKGKSVLILIIIAIIALFNLLIWSSFCKRRYPSPIWYLLSAVSLYALATDKEKKGLKNRKYDVIGEKSLV